MAGGSFGLPTREDAFHQHGDEAEWWKTAGIDVGAIAHRLWQHTRLNGTPIQPHLYPIARSILIASGERRRSRTVCGSRGPMTSWRQFQANRLNALKSTRAEERRCGLLVGLLAAAERRLCR